ncbi:unnamed protein product [Amoebophrya sp. A120]|nr:unnamed protein product [Amoebophrya sp. A120]|eukprot:GSA120T00026236001.1
MAILRPLLYHCSGYICDILQNAEKLIFISSHTALEEPSPGHR